MTQTIKEEIAMAMKLSFTRALLFLAVLLLMGVVTPVRADSVGVGNSSSSDPPPFLFFDENGNGFFQFFDFTTPVQGVLAPDPSGSGIPIALTYFLAATSFGTVNNGDVLISNATEGLGDVIRFTDAAGNLTGHTADRMIYYSDIVPGDVETDLADTPFAPINLGSGTTAFATEDGAEGNGNGFFYFALNNQPGIGIYVGNSDAPAPVPEPASLLLLGSGLFVLWGFRHRRAT
jgi:hypothetical protein